MYRENPIIVCPVMTQKIFEQCNNGEEKIPHSDQGSSSSKTGLSTITIGIMTFLSAITEGETKAFIWGGGDGNRSIRYLLIFVYKKKHYGTA